MTTASIGQSVVYSRMLEQVDLPMDQAHVEFTNRFDEMEPQPSRVIEKEQKRAVLAAGMRARGEDRQAAAMAGVL